MTSTAPCSPAAVQAMSTESAGAIATVMKSLADPLRVRMLSAITADPRGEVCVCDLEGLAEVSQPTISHHLKVLRSAGVVESERRGTWVYYRVASALREPVTAMLGGFAVALTDTTTNARMVADVDARLEGAATVLAAEHADLDRALVAHVVRESYTSLLAASAPVEDVVDRAITFARQRLSDLAMARSLPAGTADDRATGAGAPMRVLFVCVANAGRSQLAAALVNARSKGPVVARSAGSHPVSDIHVGVRTLLEAIDPGTAQDAFPKPVTDDAVRTSDLVITMGCGDVCPVIPGVRYDDWAVGDPALASDDGVARICDDIARRVDALLHDLENGIPA